MNTKLPYLIRPPKVYQWLFKDAVFREDPNQQKVFLTFDDGPDPEATPLVLKVLADQGVSATFFMLGKNVKLHPQTVDEVNRQGHAIGNHGMEHINGWTTPTDLYVENVRLGKELTGSALFRPPYGKLTLSQYLALKKTENLIFWDVISGDFDTAISPEKVRKNVLDNVRNGSVIVMHDSKKAMNNLQGSLNAIIIGLKQKGYDFGLIQRPG